MTDRDPLESGATHKETTSSHSPGKSNDEKFLQELDCPNSYDELKIILSKINDENPSSETLFKGKYMILLLKNFLTWQKPLGEFFQTAMAICGAKLRKFSAGENCPNEVFLKDAGCPLPLQLDNLVKHGSVKSQSHSLLEQLNEKYILYPLSQNVGGKVLTMCNSIETESAHKLPLAAICYGKNSKAAVLLGSSRENNSRLLLTNQGSISKQEQLPRLSSLKEKHLQGFPPSFSTIQTSVFASYDFLEYESDKKSSLKPVKESSVVMECWWSNSFSLLEPLTDDCTCFAKLKAVTGSTGTGAFSLYKEILFVEALQSCLQTGVMTWSNRKSDGDVMKSLKDFINGEKAVQSRKDKPTPSLTDMQFFDNTVLRNRDNLDFTEKLWTILKDCSSCEELQEGLSFVYNALGEFLAPPFVYHKNMTSIALSVKNMMEKLIICPILEPKLAVQLLLEIGVEKLRRDYITLFLSLGLIPFESISYFVQPELSSPEAVMCLKKLHSVLELAIVCVKRLSLSKTHLSEFVRNTLKHYTLVPDIDLSHIFSFQIPVIKARQLLNPLRPTVWEISFVSSVDGFMKQSAHRYITTPIHDHICAPDNYHPKLMLKTALYTYFTAILVQDDLL